MPFVLARSSNQSPAEEKGDLDNAAVFAKNEKSKYSQKVDVSLEGSMISASDSKDVRFI